MDGATAQPVFEILTDHDHVLLSVLPSGERQPITDKAPPVECARVSGWGGAALKLKMRELKMEEHIARVENTGVENTGTITHGKPSKPKTLSN